ncbi:MAG: UDP-glucuronic acid decarboxylase family protein [Oricola sp.]
MTSLVTGGAGFLGYNLCRRLLDQGDKVVCIDDMTSGLQAHIDELSGHSRFEFLLHDVTKPLSLKVDRIFNLACPASPPAYQADPIKTTLTSVLGVLNMLELALQNGARIFHASTSEVYGDPLEHPQKETYHGNVNTMGPRACYDEGKRCAETLLHDYHRIRGADIRVARIFNTYGPGMRADDGRVISNFVTQALSGEDLTVYGDGSYTRSFCYVDDLIDGMMALMEHDGDYPLPVNLGNPDEFSIAKLASLVIEATGSDSRIVNLPNAPDDPKVRCPDISRAKATFGWGPKVPLEQGLVPTIEYFRQVGGGER